MRLELNLKMTPTVSPQMILSMTMLQYSGQELEEYLEELSYENPLMELQEREIPKEKAFADRLRWLKNGDRQNRTYYSDQEEWRGEASAGTWQPERLQDHLKEQILLLKIPREMRRAMEVITELLSPRGFFDGSAEEVARLADCGTDIAQEAIERIKTLSPAGVGARDVRESLLIQLASQEVRDEVAERLVAEQFEHLASWPTPRLAGAVGATKTQVDMARKRIASLKPYPGDGFASRDSVLYVKPDLYVSEDAEGFSVEACEDAVPTVVVNSQYLKMLESEQDPEVQKYLRQKLGELEQVIKNLGNRKSTMVRCAECIAARQTAFFRGGGLVKMTLKDVADEMGVHESTVSRTVRNKYIQCSRGIFEMASFFSRDAGQNIGVSRNHIKDRLTALIEAEDPARPMSDEKIVEKLGQENIIISRRTVSKYRMELGILPASARKTQKSVQNSDVYKNRTKPLLEE